MIKAKTCFVNSKIFTKEFFAANKGILVYKMRIVRQEFMHLIKEVAKRDSFFALLFFELSFIEEILKKIRNEDLMVIIFFLFYIEI